MKKTQTILTNMNTTTFLMRSKCQIQTIPATRYLFTVLAVALLATFIAALPSQAQSTNGWDDRFWPANEKPPRAKEVTNWVFQSDVISSNIVYSVKERYDAVEKQDTFDLLEDFLIIPVRRPDEKLQEAKEVIGQIIGGFLDQTRFPTPYDPTSIIITTTNTSYLQLIYWNETNILSHCELPTNFFSYTPPRNLAGHEGTGAAHWTNSAQYGWDAMRKVITNLIYTYEPKGAMINQTVEVYKASLNLDGDQYAAPDGNCVDNSGQPPSPIPFDELTLANYTDGTGYSKGAGRRQVFLPDPNPPQRTDWFERGLWIGAFYNIEFSSGVNGILAARLGTSGIASNSGHVAFTFERESGQGPESCGFTQQPQRPLPPIPIPWVFRGTIAGSQKSADNNYFVTGGVVGFDDPNCDFWSEEVMGDFFDYGIDAGDTFCLGCLGYDGCYPSNINIFNGTTGLTSTREYVHIIQWNFQYK
jgi:hypothetical protein